VHGTFGPGSGSEKSQDIDLGIAENPRHLSQGSRTILAGNGKLFAFGMGSVLLERALYICGASVTGLIREKQSASRN